VLSPDGFQMDNKTGNVTRVRTAPPLSSSEGVCPLLTDAAAAEWVRVHHAACWANWRQSQKAVAAPADIVSDIHQSGMRTVAAVASMAGAGIISATHNTDNRPVFRAMAIALEAPGAHGRRAGVGRRCYGQDGSGEGRGGEWGLKGEVC